MKKAIILIKGDNVKLSKYLFQNEIDCKCTSKWCNHTIITNDNLTAFDKTRDEFGKPIVVASGFRCNEYNKEPTVGGVAKSKHPTGDALDLLPLYGGKEELDRLEEIARKHYIKVIRYKTFIHCDCRFYETIYLSE